MAWECVPLLREAVRWREVQCSSAVKWSEVLRGRVVHEHLPPTHATDTDVDRLWWVWHVVSFDIILYCLSASYSDFGKSRFLVWRKVVLFAKIAPNRKKNLGTDPVFFLLQAWGLVSSSVDYRLQWRTTTTTTRGLRFRLSLNAVWSWMRSNLWPWTERRFNDPPPASPSRSRVNRRSLRVCRYMSDLSLFPVRLFVYIFTFVFHADDMKC